MQENLTAEIIDAINHKLNPAWAACAITATHGCMTLRGIRDTCTDTTTFQEVGESTPNDRNAFWDAAHH